MNWYLVLLLISSSSKVRLIYLPDSVNSILIESPPNFDDEGKFILDVELWNWGRILEFGISIQWKFTILGLLELFLVYDILLLLNGIVIVAILAVMSNKLKLFG